MHVVCCEDFETELEEGYIEFEAVFEKLRTIYVTIAKILKRLTILKLFANAFRCACEDV